MSKNSEMAANNHPRADDLGWVLQSSRMPYENGVVRLREDQLTIPEKGSQTFAYLLQGKAVMMVPVTEEGQILVIRQYRYPVDEHCLEVPAGKAGDTPELSLEEVAAKEMKEEVGGTFARLEFLGSSYTNPSMGDEECHYYLAMGVKLDQETQREPMEEIEVGTISASEAVCLAKSGGFRTAPAALAILLAEPRLRELGLM